MKNTGRIRWERNKRNLAGKDKNKEGMDGVLIVVSD